jgi:hypothetical protein
MLTDHEREVVLKRLDEYPAGVPAGAWGYGPMMGYDYNGDVIEDGGHSDPAFLARSTRQEYG